MIKNLFLGMFNNAVNLNKKNIYKLLEINPEAKFLDLGCDDGALSLLLADQIRTKKIYGVDLDDKSLEKAKKNGLKVKKCDLNAKFPLPDRYYDVVYANQVIEHIGNSDNFVSEVFRIVKKGGYAIISTENASSWHNIFASVMGWQIFSLTNFSSMKCGIGNPMALHRSKEPDLKSWNHVRIYNFRGLKEYFEAAGFKVEKTLGAGYHPFHPALGNIDKNHCHFMTFKLRK